MLTATNYSLHQVPGLGHEYGIFRDPPLPCLFPSLPSQSAYYRTRARRWPTCRSWENCLPSDTGLC